VVKRLTIVLMVIAFLIPTDVESAAHSPATSYYTSAVTLMRRGKWRGARTLLNLARKDHPEPLAVLLALGRCHEKLGEREQAMACYRELSAIGDSLKAPSARQGKWLVSAKARLDALVTAGPPAEGTQPGRREAPPVRREAKTLDPGAVMKVVAPSVVRITNWEGSGSGVALEAGGLILANYSMVNMPIPFKVTAQVQRGRKQTAVTFENVSIVGVHPRYDAALLQVEATGVRLIPATRAPEARLLPGSVCYTVGSGGGPAKQGLTNTISPGIISASDRQVGGLTFIQASTRVDRGTTGGALVNGNGQLIGIVAFKVEDTEGLGFAIPLAHLRRQEFTPFARLKWDPAKAREWEKQGETWLRAGDKSVGAERRNAYEKALAYFRKSLIQARDLPRAFLNVGILYHRTRQFEVAEQFYRKALELRPDYPHVCDKLGLLEFRRKRLARAEAWWGKGMATKSTQAEDRDAAAACAQNYCIGKYHQDRPIEAAYLAKWGLWLTPRGPRAQQFGYVVRLALSNLNDAQFAYVQLKKSGFSFEDLEMYKKMKADAFRPPKGKRRIAPRAKAVSMGQALQEAAAAPSPGPAGLKAKLPDRLTGARLAFGGAYLVLQFKSLPRLGLFNIAKAQFDGYFELDGIDTLYAAGGKYLLLYSRAREMFEWWDLSTRTKTREHLARVCGTLTHLEMGYRNDRAAVVSYADSRYEQARRYYAFLDLKTFQVTEFRNRFYNIYYRDNVHLRPGPEMKRVAVWCTSRVPVPEYCEFLHLKGKVASLVVNRFSHSGLSFADGRKRVYAGKGYILTPEGQDLRRYRGSHLFPVMGADYYVEFQVRTKRAHLRHGPSHRIVRSFVLPFSLERTYAWHPNDFTEDRRVWAVAAIDRIAFIDDNSQMIYVHDLGLKASQPKP